MNLRRNGIRCLIALLCVLLFFCCGTAVPATDFSFYDTDYETDTGKLTIHVHNSYTTPNAVDLKEPIKEAASLGAFVQINAGNIRFYLNADAVRKFAASEEPLYLLALTSSSGEDSADTSENAEPIVERCYRLRLGTVDFDYGTLRVRIRYVPKNAEILTVFTRNETGEERELDFGYEEKYVSFYPESLDEDLEFVIAERATEEMSVPKLPFLLAGVLGLLLIASAVTAALLKMGKLKRFFKGNDTP